MATTDLPRPDTLKIFAVEDEGAPAGVAAGHPPGEGDEGEDEETEEGEKECGATFPAKAEGAGTVDLSDIGEIETETARVYAWDGERERVPPGRGALSVVLFVDGRRIGEDRERIGSGDAASGGEGHCRSPSGVANGLSSFGRGAAK